MPLAPGQDLSHYRLVEQIGEGGMGVVWRATDTTLGRDVAIKVLPELFASDPERMARFEREARVLASLNHPGIAAIYGVGHAAGVHFLAMELVEGDDLASRIEQGSMPVVEALETARRIAEGLEVAHEKGIIHRDLKPANVRLTHDGQVKLLDFGLAKGAEPMSGAGRDSGQSPTITSLGTVAGVILGTAAYMSPEQARGKAVDRRTDIWAFGCVLFECLTGQRVFAGETVSDTLAKILERDPDLKALPGATPPRVRELLQRCLVKDPKLRLRDIGDARIVLEEVLASRSPSGRLVVTDVGGEGAARRRAPWAAIAVAGAAGLVLGAVLWGTLGSGARGGVAPPQPSCVNVTLPPGIKVQFAQLTRDGRTLVVNGRPDSAEGSKAAQPRLYARRLDGYEFKELPGTEGASNFTLEADGRSLLFLAPVAPGAPGFRWSRIPIDGNSPATTLGNWKESWFNSVELDNGDHLAKEGDDTFVVVPKSGGAPSQPVKLDAGRQGVSRYEFPPKTLPGDRAVFVDVVMYDARGWHYSVGVADVKSGKVKIVEEDGGSGRYSPTGHLLFARGGAILAAPFDLGSLDVRGAPVAVWSGINTRYAFFPGVFQLTDDGALFYRPGQSGGDRSISILDASGKLAPWSAEQRAMDGVSPVSRDGRRVVASIVNARGIDEVWVSPTDHADFQRLGTDPNADCSWPIWSPDGKRIAYLRHGSDDRDGIYIQNADGGEAKRILKGPSTQDQAVPVSWLPDGTALLLMHPEGGKVSLKLLPLTGGEADAGGLRPILASTFNRALPTISPDGRLLAFNSDETGKPQTWVVEFHSGGGTGRPVQVKTSGSRDHKWAADGKTLFVQDERDRLMKVSVTAGSELVVSAPTEVCDLDKLRVAMWTALADGRFLVGLKNDNESEITHYNLVLNWTEELKQKILAAR